MHLHGVPCSSSLWRTSCLRFPCRGPATICDGGISLCTRIIRTHFGILLFASARTRIISRSEYGAYLPLRYSSYRGVSRITSDGYIFSMSGLRSESSYSLAKSSMSMSGVIVGSPGIMCAAILYPASFASRNDLVTSAYVCPLLVIWYTWSRSDWTPISTLVAP